MPTYIVLGKFEREGVQRIVEPPGSGAPAPDIAQLAPDIAEGLQDVSVEETWYTTSAYDVVIKLEAPDNGAALGFAAAYAFEARATTQTLAAERADVVGQLARDAHTRHEGEDG